jgi:hypothetical protein
VLFLRHLSLAPPLSCQTTEPPAYIAFIDESGDPGLKATASEWFIPSAVLVRAENERLIQGWIAAIKAPMKNQKRADLHFTKLNLGMRQRAATMLADYPIRGFTNISRKGNMVHYRNLRAENRPENRIYRDDGTWFMKPRNEYFQNWMTKVLVERVTWYCARRSIREFGKPRVVKLVIASRDGFYIGDFINYLMRDQSNQQSGKATLRFHPDWRVLDWRQIKEAPAANVPGLQLADIVCGAFSHAVDRKRYGQCDPTYAKALFNKMARNAKGQHVAFGVTAWPKPLTKGNRPLHPEQWEIFRFYGFDEETWLGRPGPTFSAR